MPLTETLRKAVDPSECDILGHMNVSRYFAACSDAVFSLQTDLGLGLSEIVAGRRLSLAVVRAESDFKSEVMAGEVIVMKSGIEEIGNKSMTIRHRLFRMEPNVVAFEAIFRCVLLDLEARRATVIPDDMRLKAKPYLIGRDRDG